VVKSQPIAKVIPNKSANPIDPYLSHFFITETQQ
jgi:hypothetical protein